MDNDYILCPPGYACSTMPWHPLWDVVLWWSLDIVVVALIALLIVGAYWVWRYCAEEIRERIDLHRDRMEVDPVTRFENEEYNG